jgi:hypothetical protein
MPAPQRRAAPPCWLAKLLVDPYVNILAHVRELIDHEVMYSTCLCGHDRSAHDHYRGGTDCAACSDRQCRAFRSDTLIGRSMNRLISGRSHQAADADSSVGAASVGQRVA